MTPGELETYLFENIPLSRAMQVSVVSVQPESVVLSAPLAPNVNVHETVFGGSASAVALLAAWSLLYLRMVGAGVSGHLVIQRNTMNFELPISGSFTAHSSFVYPASWEPFVRLLRRKGMARITMSSILVFSGQTTGRFEGEFVAVGGTMKALNL